MKLAKGAAFGTTRAATGGGGGVQEQLGSLNVPCLCYVRKGQCQK